MNVGFRPTIVLAAILTAGTLVAACGPNQKRIDCEERGGVWESGSKVEYAYNIQTGQYGPTLISYSYCGMP